MTKQKQNLCVTDTANRKKNWKFNMVDFANNMGDSWFTNEGYFFISILKIYGIESGMMEVIWKGGPTEMAAKFFSLIWLALWRKCPRVVSLASLNYVVYFTDEFWILGSFCIDYIIKEASSDLKAKLKTKCAALSGSDASTTVCV